MNPFVSLLLAGIFFSAVYYLFTTVLVRLWMGEPVEDADEALPPVTFFRPVKGGVPRLGEKIEMLISAAREGDQVIVGAGSEADAAVCREAAGGRADVTVLLCPEAPDILNPKIAKLVAMTAEARHEHWLVSDSETLLTREFVDGFRAEWTRCDALSAGYRFTGASNLPQRLDQLSTLLTLWPGLAAARLGSAPVLLGACFGVQARDLKEAGGWKAFGGFLAEDNRLGVTLAAGGRKVALSHGIVTLEADEMSWRGYFAHQHRAAVTYRVCNPAGYAGMVATHGITFGALLVAMEPGRPLWWFILAGILGARWASVKSNAAALKFPARSGPGLILFGSLAESWFWLLSWLPLPVRWARLHVRTDPRGVMRGA